jgi:hypothetical protein
MTVQLRHRQPQLRHRQPGLGNLGALFQQFEVVPDRFVAHGIGMGLARGPDLDQTALGLSVVEFGMIGHQYRGAGGKDCTKACNY